MKRKSVLAGLMTMVAAVTLFAQVPALECRTWVLKSGTKLEGTFKRYFSDPKYNNNETVGIILKETGKERGVSYDRLSDEDKAYIEKMVADGLIKHE